jgi:hypothetical protein
MPHVSQFVYKTTCTHMKHNSFKLIIQCWDGDPVKRPSFDEILDRLFEIRKTQSHNPTIKSRSFKGSDGNIDNSSVMNQPSMHLKSTQDEDIKTETGVPLAEPTVDIPGFVPSSPTSSSLAPAHERKSTSRRFPSIALPRGV